MNTAEDLTEYRKQQRFSTRDGIFAVCYADILILGKVLNISRGGLAFQYVSLSGEDGEMAEGRADLEVFEKSSDRCLRGIPCSVVYDLKVPLGESFLNNYQLRRCGIQFGELSPKQHSQVESFISHLLSESPRRTAFDLPSYRETVGRIGNGLRR